MKRLCLSPLVLLLLVFSSAVGQSQTPATRAKALAPAAKNTTSYISSEDIGLSTDRLERIADNVNRSINNGRISGAVTLVARHSRIAYFKAFGMADRETKRSMRTDDIFRICSMTKPITSVAIMMLYEEGHFLLDEPVSNFIPEFKHMKVLEPPYPQDKTSAPGPLTDAKRPVTIRHLLTHTSGLTYHWNQRLGKQYREAGIGHGLIQREGTIGDAVKKLGSIPLLFQPGDAWEYSLADDVLGYLVEVVSGMSLDRFFQERVFKPLGMKDTCFFLPDEKVPRLAAAYTYDSEKGLQPFPEKGTREEGAFAYSSDYPSRGPRTYFSGGGGLCSTAEDYYHFCQMMLNNGKFDGARLLSRKAIELISQNHVQGKLDDQGYGLGFGVTSEARHLTELGSIGAYYWGGFYYTAFVIDPKEDMIVIFMAQLHPTGDLNLDSKVLRLAYQAIID